MMISKKLVLNTSRRIFQKAKNNIRVEDLFSFNKWRYWLVKASQELDRSRMEMLGRDEDGPLEQVAAEQAYRSFNTVHPNWIKILEKAAVTFEYQPLFSIIMPVYNTDKKYLQEAIGSIANQIYPFWELCIADDGSTKPETLEALSSFSHEQRIKILHRQATGNICAASNDAAQMATGDFLIFMDHDDVIPPEALFDIAEILQTNRTAKIVYSDEAKITETGDFYDAHFKPDWSPTLLLSYNYINHLVCMERGLFESVDGFRKGTDGAQDYDLLLRTCFKCAQIIHIPKILYYWRAVPGSTARQASDKPQVSTAAYQALVDAIERMAPKCHVYTPSWAKMHKLPVYQLDGPDDGPCVDIIIPTRNQGRQLLKCIDSILKETTYRNYRILIINNDSDDPETLNIFARLNQHKNIDIEVISNDEDGFSFASICNKAAKLSQADYLLFLNDDTEILTKRWLSRMLAYCALPEVGIIGACLLYPDKKTIQHGGVLLNMNEGVAPAHAFKGASHIDMTYFFMGKSARECSAVTGACLLTPRKLFQTLDGFDEFRFPVSLNDVDYCLRGQIEGKKRTIYVPGATLVHHESLSRSKEDDPVELAKFNQHYRNFKDPYYNPNLSNAIDFKIAPTSSPNNYIHHINRPLKVLIFSHNLNLEGASKVAVALTRHLSTFDTISTKLISFLDGPLHHELTEADIPVSVHRLEGTDNVLQGWTNQKGLDNDIREVESILSKEKPDVIIANVLNNFFVVNAALKYKVPTVWIIHESYTKKELFEILPPFVKPYLEQAIQSANRAVFVSKETQSLYKRYNRQHNFIVIRNCLDKNYPKKLLHENAQSSLKQKMGIPSDRKVILNVGTVCERKDQTTLIRAASIMSKKRDDFVFILVGARRNDLYTRRIGRLIKRLNLSENVLVVDETPDVHHYYQAADIFAFTSLNESYSLTILEAMAYGLPIVTTPCIGIVEQVRFNINALPFGFSDEQALARQLGKLLNEPDLIAQMGRNSKNIWRYLPTFDNMIDQYRDVVESVAQESIIPKQLMNL